MQKIITLLICFFTSILMLSAQEQKIFTGIKHESYAQNENLRRMFSSFEIFKLNSNELKNYCSSQQSSAFDLVLGNKLLRTSLVQNDIRSANYRLILGTDNGNIEIPKGPNITYMGFTSDGAKVRMTINDNFIVGLFKLRDESFYIEPLNGLVEGVENDLFVFYSSKNVIPNPNNKCGLVVTEHKTQELTQQHQHSHKDEGDRTTTQCLNISLAIASDYDMYANQFGSNVTNLTNFTTSVTNNVITDYDDSFDKIVNFTTVTNFVSTTAGNPFETSLSSSTDGDVLLCNFSIWASSPTFIGGGFGMAHDLGSVWVKRDFSGTVIGKAWSGGLCTPIYSSFLSCAGNPAMSIRYNILESNFSSANATSLRVMTSHEYGHNFNYVHDPAGSTTIMAPTVNNTTSWSPASVTTMDAHMVSSDCINGTTAIPGSPIAKFNLSSTQCINSSIPLIDLSGRNPTAWNWTATGGGTVTSASSQNTSVSFSAVGSKDVTLAVTNSACGGAQGSNVVKSINIVNQTAPASVCSISSTNIGSNFSADFGIQKVKLGTIELNSSGTRFEGAVYVDRVCANYTTLSALTNPFEVRVGNDNPERVKVYVDANNNGTYQSDEMMLMLSGTGLLTGQLVLPSSILRNTLLRMRIVSDYTGNTVAPCNTPTYGQVEDYGIIVDNTCGVSPNPCGTPISNNNTGVSHSANLGIKNVTLGSINLTSSGSYGDEIAYKDAYCNNVTTLNSLSNSISITVGTGNNERVNVFIDKNNNGTFEAAETMFSTLPSGQATLTGTFTIAPPFVTGTKLLMRVVSDFTGSGIVPSPCTTPVYGQVEDYGVILSAALPVTLTQFIARALSDGKNIITWQTSLEQHSERFVIERSQDGERFEPIGEQKALGNINGIKNYTFTDKNPLKSINYYRLKMVDNDGKSENSSIESVVRKEFLAFDVSIYPNPSTTGIFNFNANKEWQKILIINSLGEILQELSYDYNENILLDISNYPNGIYPVIIQTEEGNLVKKLVKNN